MCTQESDSCDAFAAQLAAAPDRSALRAFAAPERQKSLSGLKGGA
jgi:hypothetical protein